jgi:crossover junction endodeoxyribonuclease RusA
LLPFEFIVEGIPVSHQTKNRPALKKWKTKVETEARKFWSPKDPPTSQSVELTITFFYEKEPLDVDNMIKPIQDALNKLVYKDDKQITDVHGRKRDIRGNFILKDVSPILIEALIKGKEFIHVKIELAPDQRKLVP